MTYDMKTRRHTQYLLEYMENHTERYNAIVKYAKENFGRMVTNAQMNGISIADQIEMGTGCSYWLAEEVARSVNLLKQI